MPDQPSLAPLQSAPNARVTALDSTTVLQYGLSVTPSPLTVSDVVPAQPATLQLVVTNFTADPVAFDQIDLSFFVGGSPSTELALTPSVATTNATVSDSDNWDFGISGAAPSSGQVTYTLAPSPSGSGALDAFGSVSVTLFPLPAPAAVGIAPVWVDETIEGDKETAKFQVTKYPEGFVFDSLTVCVTDPATQQLVPVSQLGYMQPFTLTWNGSDPVASHYTVYASSLTGQVPAAVTSVGQWPSTGLASDTIFTLIVVTTGPDGTTPVTASLSVAVQVVQPDIKVGNATVAGAATVGTAAAPGSLTVNGNTLLCANSPTPPYSATLDVQNGWTRIGCFNTTTIPEPSNWGGMVVGWNRSNGSAETNLYNVFPDANTSFVFSQIVKGGGEFDLLSISGNGVDISGALNVALGAAVESLTIGDWTIMVDASGNFVLLNPSGTTVFQCSPAGVLGLGGGLNQVITDQTQVFITNDQGWLNGTTQEGGWCDNMAAAAFWMSGTPDGDSTLRITTQSPE